MDIEEVKRAHVLPGDVIVLECAEHLPIEAHVRLRQTLQGVWPDHKCVVLDAGMSLRIVRPVPEGAGVEVVQSA